MPVQKRTRAPGTGVTVSSPSNLKRASWNLGIQHNLGPHRREAGSGQTRLIEEESRVSLAKCCPTNSCKSLRLLQPTGVKVCAWTRCVT